MLSVYILYADSFVAYKYILCLHCNQINNQTNGYKNGCHDKTVIHPFSTVVKVVIVIHVSK